MIPWASNGIPVRTFACIARQFDAAALSRELSPAFLLYFGIGAAFMPLGRTKPGVLPRPTDNSTTASLGLRFLPLRRAPERSGNPFIGVGRLDGNDVAIAEPSVSKFHALIRMLDDGDVVVQDAGSANGTFVNRVRVAVRDKGPPSRIASGDTIHFGGAACTFLPAPDALAFMRDYFDRDA